MHNSLIKQSYDLIVVGLGAAGCYLASKLSDKPNVLFIERGPKKAVKDFKEESDGVVVKGEYSRAATGRKFGVGGSTNLWGGQLLPFSRQDFEGYNWPFTYTEYIKHGEAVFQELLGFIPSKVFIEQSPHKYFLKHDSYWINEQNFRKRYFQELSKSDILINARVLSFSSDKIRNLVTIRLKVADKEVTTTCKRLILACGTFETIRIIDSSISSVGLSSPKEYKFVDHISSSMTKIVPFSRWKFLSQYNTKYKSGIKHTIRFSTTREWEKSSHIRASAMLVIKQPSSFFGFLANVLTSAMSRVFLGFVFKPYGDLYLNVMAQQLFSDLSTVQFSRLPDNSQSFIRWKVSAHEMSAIKSFSDLIVDFLVHSGDIKTSTKLKPEAQQYIDVCHPMGGLSIYLSDSYFHENDFRRFSVKGNPNVLLCSSAVFPTGSHSNPTFTLLTMAEMLSSQLINQL